MRSAASQIADEVATRAVVSSANPSQDSNAAWARLQDLLPRAQNDYYLDFVVITDPAGRVIARHNDKPGANETLLGADYNNPIAQRAVSDGAQLRAVATAACAVEQGAQLQRLGLDLRVQLRPDDSTVTDALMIEAGAPIIISGRFIGTVIIGQLLNNYYPARAGATPIQTHLAGEVRHTLFRGDDRASGALIAFGDRIIASSIPASGQSREPLLHGAPHDLSAAEEKVEAEGRDFIIAWHPLVALDGTKLGDVGVARAEDEALFPVGRLQTVFLGIGLSALLFAGAAGFLAGYNLASRVSTLHDAATRMGHGELSAPVKDPLAPGSSLVPDFFRQDEISRLADEMDQMRDSFRQAIDRMRKR